MGVRRRDRAASDDAKAILNLVRQLVRPLRAFEKQAQTRFGFGAAQMSILHVLHHEDDLLLNELADRTATDQSSASLAVGKLVSDGRSIGPSPCTVGGQRCSTACRGLPWLGQSTRVRLMVEWRLPCTFVPDGAGTR